MRPYQALGASSAWFAVLAQYYLSTTESGLVHGTVIYFGFFTILGNILVALAFTAPLFPNAPPSSFFIRPAVRTAIGVYILVIAVIFYFLLRKLYRPTGLGWFVNILLHYINPPLYLLDWLVFTPKQNLRFGQIPLYLIFPLTYAVYTLLHGAVSGYYPYPFLNAASFGYARVSINIAALSAFFIILSAAFIALGRNLSPPQKH